MSKNQTGLVSPANYLTRMAKEAEKRKWPRRDCELCVGLLYAQRGLRVVREGKIWLHDISEGGAAASSRVRDLPEHFYIFFGEYQYFIGCILIDMRDGFMRLRFIREQPTEFINILSRITDAFEFRGQVRLSLYGLPDPATQGSTLSALRELDGQSGTDKVRRLG